MGVLADAAIPPAKQQALNARYQHPATRPRHWPLRCVSEAVRQVSSENSVLPSLRSSSKLTLSWRHSKHVLTAMLQTFTASNAS